MPTIPLRDRPAWQALRRHHGQIEGRHLRELFADDPGRGERMCAQAAGLYLDYSKNRITDETLQYPSVTWILLASTRSSCR
ncbi:hypothetical protein Psi02_70670 [Planotetraspora silvatica]|uniref:Glucose-6-phosphate isomerase n=1 Tax=Planotetraspora silvatica TaxID=234614 RepID=A0A8J3XVI5_9ACTN|nr:hypothetical protein [Planotetraspora silvatica]GII50643.1 hypothetical protein Psi02_70670 [Planotetraspora silvatica]